MRTGGLPLHPRHCPANSLPGPGVPKVGTQTGRLPTPVSLMRPRHSPGSQGLAPSHLANVHGFAFWAGCPRERAGGQANMWEHQPVLGTLHFSGCKPQAALGGGQHPHSTDEGVSSRGAVTHCRQQRAGPAPARSACRPPSAPAGTPQLPFRTPKVKRLPSPFPWTKLLLLFISASWQPRPMGHPCWGCPRVPV